MYWYVITVTSLIKFGKLNISELEDGRIFVLSDYFKDKRVIMIDDNVTLINMVREYFSSSNDYDRYYAN